MERIPETLFSNILTHLNRRDLLNIRAINKHFRAIIDKRFINKWVKHGIPQMIKNIGGADLSPTPANLFLKSCQIGYLPLTREALPHISDEIIERGLFDACRNSHCEIVKCLINRLNIGKKILSVFEIACLVENPDIIALLCEKTEKDVTAFIDTAIDADISAHIFDHLMTCFPRDTPFKTTRLYMRALKRTANHLLASHIIRRIFESNCEQYAFELCENDERLMEMLLNDCFIPSERNPRIIGNTLRKFSNEFLFAEFSRRKSCIIIFRAMFGIADISFYNFISAQNLNAECVEYLLRRNKKRVREKQIRAMIDAMTPSKKLTTTSFAHNIPLILAYAVPRDKYRRYIIRRVIDNPSALKIVVDGAKPRFLNYARSLMNQY